MKNYLLPVFLFLLSTQLIHAQFPTLSLSEYITGLDRPVEITHAGDGSNRLFIIEQDGRIRIFDQNTNTLLATPFLDITSIVRCCGERGLLGLAFHPDYANNGRFFVNYTSRSRPGINNGTSIIAEYLNPDPPSNTMEAISETILL
ncbi:MAG: PQQ-dependent sugar dehydrogenase, partial [Bacteroidota bacterium]